MEYSYKVESIQPKAEYMRVRYSAEGHDDFIKSFNPRQFDEQHLVEIITGFAPAVIEAWERIAQHPENIVVNDGIATAEAPVVVDVDPTFAPEIEPRPAFDPFTQYITLNQIEDPMQATVGWTIHDMTAEQIAEYLANWRSNAQVTMRQARLVLAQQGLLQTVEDAISLIPEPDKSTISIEWEYSAVVHRASAWVGVLAPALGLTDEQMDELFKVASTL